MHDRSLLDNCSAERALALVSSADTCLHSQNFTNCSGLNSDDGPQWSCKLGERRSPAKNGRGTPRPRGPPQFDHWIYQLRAGETTSGWQGLAVRDAEGGAFVQCLTAC